MDGVAPPNSFASERLRGLLSGSQIPLQVSDTMRGLADGMTMQNQAASSGSR